MYICRFLFEVYNTMKLARYYGKVLKKPSFGCHKEFPNFVSLGYLQDVFSEKGEQENSIMFTNVL